MTSLNGRPSTARLFDFNDREILAVVRDHADGEGWASTAQLAEVVFPHLGSESRHAMRCIAIRLAWLRRFEVIEKGERTLKVEGRTEHETTWRLTGEGEAFVSGRLTTAQRRLVDEADESMLLPLMARVGVRYRGASAVGARLIRREWQHGSAPR